MTRNEYRTRAVNGAHHQRRLGQSMVEFALVAPIAIALLTATLSAAWLFFQSSALADGARGGARMSSIQTSLATKNAFGVLCESAAPQSIAAAVAHDAVQLSVNPSQLCAAPGSTTRLIQPNDPNRVNIQVDALPDLANPKTVTVTLTFNAHGIAPPLGINYPLTATSTMPELQG